MQRSAFVTSDPTCTFSALPTASGFPFRNVPPSLSPGARLDPPLSLTKGRCDDLTLLLMSWLTFLKCRINKKLSPEVPSSSLAPVRKQVLFP